MSALTGQEVVSAISTKLRSRFTTSQIAEIYKDKPVQHMALPCIFIHEVDAAHRPAMRNTGWWDYIIDIRCHPDTMRTNISTWGRGLAVMILETVETIEVSGDIVKIRDAEWKVEDGVLHVIVKYSFRVYSVGTEIPDMETLTYGERIKR